MRVSFKKRTPGRIELGIIYGGIAFLSLAAVRFLPELTTLLPSCAFKGITGIPCPTCGSTRSAVHLAQGDILASLGMNPFMAVILIFGLLYFVYSALTFLFSMQRIDIIFTDHEKNAIRLIVAALAVLNWWYLVITL